MNRPRRRNYLVSSYLIAALVVSMTLTGFLTSTSTGAIKEGFTYFFTPLASATSAGDGGGGDGDAGNTGNNDEVTGDDGGSDNGNEQNTENDDGDISPSDSDNAPNQDVGINGEQSIDCPTGEHLDENANICVSDTSQQQQAEGLTPPPALNQQTICPDKSTPDNSSNCPAPATSPIQDSHILVMSNADGPCPEGSHKFPERQVCEKDAVSSTSGDGTTTTTESNASPLTPQQQYEVCLRGIGGDIPGNCTPPPISSPSPPATTTEQNVKQQTLIQQQACKDGSTPDANGICQDGLTPQQTCQDDDMCSPVQAHYNIPSNVVKDQDGTCPIGYHSNSNTDLQCEINSQQKLPNGTCPDGTILTKDDLCVLPPVISGSTTGQGGGFIQMLPTKSANTSDGTDGTGGGTPPSQFVPAVNGECPPGSYEAGGSPGNAGQPGTGVVNCRLDDSAANPQVAPPINTTQEQTPTDTPNGAPAEQVDNLILLNKQTCPPLPIDASGRCPGIDMRGGGLGLPPVKPGVIKEKPLLPDGSCDGVFDPNTNKCYEDDYAPPCPGGYGREGGFCPTDQNGAYLPLGVNPKIPIEGPCASNKGVHLASGHGVCFLEEDIAHNPDGSCRSGYFPTGVNNDHCSLKIHDPLPDGTCPAGYHKVPTPTAPVPGGNMCKLDALKLTNDNLTSELPGGYCPVGYEKRSGFNEHQCFRIT